MITDGTQYRLVYCDILTGIYAKKWKKGETLLSLEEMCENYDIGRNTARTVIKLLEENGYVVRHGKKPPEVCFDWENAEQRKIYINELAQRKQAIEEVFQFMVALMSDLFGEIVENISDEERKEISVMLEQYIQELSKYTEQEISEGLMKIYMRALSFMGNELMESIFRSLYYFIQVPTEQETRRNLRFKASIALIKHMMKRFQKQVNEKNIEGLKEQIRFFCQSMGDNTGNYLKRICKGIHVDEEQKFIWTAKGNTAYLLLAVDIIGKIRDGTYREGEVIPSYAKLAQEAGVSEKTSRSAVKILNDWQVVTTINGIGSRVNVRSMEERRLILEEDIVKENLKRFAEAEQIEKIMKKPIDKYYGDNTSAVVTVIQQELACLQKWGQILGYCGLECKYEN